MKLLSEIRRLFALKKCRETGTAAIEEVTWTPCESGNSDGNILIDVFYVDGDE